jgi:hypothetical protein
VPYFEMSIADLERYEPEVAVPVDFDARWAATLGEARSPEQWRRACLSALAPADLFAMVGSGGERCYVVPSRKLVVVRFGTGATFSDAEFLRRLFGGR